MEFDAMTRDTVITLKSQSLSKVSGREDHGFFLNGAEFFSAAVLIPEFLLQTHSF